MDETELDSLVLVGVKSLAARRFKVWLKEAAVPQTKRGVENVLPDAGQDRATDNQGGEALDLKFASLARVASSQVGETHEAYNQKVVAAAQRVAFLCCGYDSSVPGDEEEPLTPDAAAWKVECAVVAIVSAQRGCTMSNLERILKTRLRMQEYTDNGVECADIVEALARLDNVYDAASKAKKSV